MILATEALINLPGWPDARYYYKVEDLRDAIAQHVLDLVVWDKEYGERLKKESR